MILQRKKIKKNQLGVVFKDGQFDSILREGKHWLFSPFKKVEVEIINMRVPIYSHTRLRDMVKAADSKHGVFEGLGQVLDLRDWQRALLWVEGRFVAVLPSKLYVIWTALYDVQIEVVDARKVRFEHEQLAVISRSNSDQLNVETVERDHKGVLFLDGRYHSTLDPGRYVFWRNVADVSISNVDMRETAVDVNGQDLMTSDLVTLRINAIVTYRVQDARLAVSSSDNVHQALYRAAQLALRKIVGQHRLDEFLDDKQQISDKALAQLTERTSALGLEIVGLGVRDVILPGEMKNLMNKVIEARKAAEANLISRREETAAIRSQANTAKLLDAHPTLMRLRELEVLEKVAGSSNLQVVLGDKEGLSDKLRGLV